MKFQDLKYTRPNLQEIINEFDSLITEIKTAENETEFFKLFNEYQELSKKIQTSATVASIRHTVDTTDEFYEKENDFYDENSPIFSDKTIALYSAILNSEYKSSLEKKYGELIILKMENALKSQSSEIISLMQEENMLETAYQKLSASAKIKFDGKELTLSQMGLYKQDPDREVRQGAFNAEGKWFDENREELDELYDKLVKNRTAQAKKLGYDSFTPLGYIRMGRAGYTRSDVESYRSAVVKYIVPLVKYIKDIQYKRTSISEPKFYDDGYRFNGGNPNPIGTPEEILAAGEKMYRELSKETAQFIDFMMKGDLFDVLSKPGKAPGGYCTYIPEIKSPFIFSNFNTTADDVDVLTHEAGHAFAAYISGRSDLPVEYADPTLEACEVHSMSMEFLTSDYHHLFFGENTKKYELSHAEAAIIFLPYGCMVDEFQHIMYDKPELTPQERNEEWAKLEEKYRPYIDFDKIPFYSRGAGWQRQLHIYECPFYYIDYCLAQTVALQFWAVWLEDKKLGFDKYLEFVKKAGTLTYTDLVKSAGLVPPFEGKCIEDLSKTLREWIDSHQI